ncbi:hypothetical protein scyTo_0016933, partial [Scyliorhinus torazame]|nr:hypothetical protein [Scyliorhinus torazame]
INENLDQKNRIRRSQHGFVMDFQSRRGKLIDYALVHSDLPVWMNKPRKKLFFPSTSIGSSSCC